MGARTATAAVGAGAPGYKKDLFGIWAAHNPAYVATVVGAEPLDLAKKFETGGRAWRTAADHRPVALPDRMGLRAGT